MLSELLIPSFFPLFRSGDAKRSTSPLALLLVLVEDVGPGVMCEPAVDGGVCIQSSEKERAQSTS